MAALLGSGAEAREWRCDPRGVAELADGSREHPFKSIGVALKAAAAGDIVVLATGLFQERLAIDKPITLRGSKRSVIASPDSSGAVLELRADATLTDFAIQGGEVGVEASSPGRLSGLSFSGQRRAAIRVSKGALQVRGGTLSALFDRSELVGIEILTGAALDAARVRLEGPFRFGIRARGADSRLTLDALDVEGPTVGIACLDGCSGTLTHSVVAQGRGAGVLAAAATFTARDNLVSRYEQGFVIQRGSTVTLEDNATAFCELVAITSIESRLQLLHHLHVSPCTLSAVQLLGSDTLIRDGLFLDPGSVGLGVRLGTTVVEGTVVKGATLDRDHIFGDALYALEPTALTVRHTFFEGNAGTGITVHDGKARVIGAELVDNSHAGLLLERRAQVTVVGASILHSLGPGLAAVEGSAAIGRSCRLVHNLGGAAVAECQEQASVGLRCTRPVPAEAALLPCVRITPER